MEKSLDIQDDLSIFKEKANYLVLGGLGFIGKNFVEALIQLDCFEKLVIVDKKLLKLNSYIPKSKLPLYESPKIVVLQKDLSRDADVKAIFTEHGPFDYVVNLAAETRYDLGEDSHKRNTLKLADTCAREAAENKVKKFIQVSTAYVYASSSKPLNENGKLDPQKTHAKYALAAERAIFRIPDLNYIILRPTIAYGPYDTAGFVALNLMASAVYKINKEKMALLWEKEKKINMVHVEDICRAIFYAIEKGNKGDIYNLSNEENVTQQKFYDHLKNIFNIDIEIVGTIKTYLAKIKFDSVIAEFNDRHMRWWFKACQDYNINNSPLNIMVYREMLEGYDLCIDGSGIKKLGFSYKHPKVTEEEILEELKYLVDMQYFPNVLDS